MRFRSLRVGLAILVLLAAGTIGPASPAATAAESPMGYYRCGGGFVTMRGPTVTAHQRAWRDGGPTFVHWRPELWYYNYNTSSWTYWQTQHYRYAEVLGNTGPSLSSGTGYAGPYWTSAADGTQNGFLFSASSGVWWAIRHVVWDQGVMSYGWALNQETEQVACRF